MISGSEYPTANLFLHELYSVKKGLDNAWNSSNDFMKEMVEKMKAKFDKYWGENNLLVAIASVMDARFKMKLIKYTFKELYSSVEASNHEEEVRDVLYKLYQEYFEDHKSNISTNQAEGSNSTVVHSSDSIDIDLSGYYNYITSVDCIETAKSELELYLEDGVVIHNPTVDPPFDALSWWKENRNKYRILSRMACDILSIPITSVASECAFSAGSRVIDPHRASLGTETVEMLICGADWIKSRYGLNKKQVSICKIFAMSTTLLIFKVYHFVYHFVL